MSSETEAALTNSKYLGLKQLTIGRSVHSTVQADGRLNLNLETEKINILVLSADAAKYMYLNTSSLETNGAYTS